MSLQCKERLNTFDNKKLRSNLKIINIVCCLLTFLFSYFVRIDEKALDCSTTFLFIDILFQHWCSFRPFFSLCLSGHFFPSYIELYQIRLAWNLFWFLLLHFTCFRLNCQIEHILFCSLFIRQIPTFQLQYFRPSAVHHGKCVKRRL